MSEDVVTAKEISLSQLKRLAAYMPVTVVERVLRHGLPTPGEPRSLLAATLFSDISGFTAMSEELASDGPRGAEELNNVLLQTFTAMINVIHRMGGAVSHFYGDAMSVYFPDTDGRAAQRALTCAQLMQQIMLTQFEKVATNRPVNKDPYFELTIKIGVGYGSCQELIVGHPQGSLEFVLTGSAVDEASAAEKKAQSGQVIASRAVLEKVNVQVASDFAEYILSADASSEKRQILTWSDFEPALLARLQAVAPAFIHPALSRRLFTNTTNLAEHRPVASLFVQFEFLGDEDESSAIETTVMGQQLHDYYEWACRVVSRFGVDNARVNRVLTGDKGNQLHIIFGAPVAPDDPVQAIRCALALQREKPDFIQDQRIGLAVGKVFAGPVGSVVRQEYTVVGDVVNLSARLMQICTAGQVFIDQTTVARVQRRFEFERLSAVKLKGKQTTIVPHMPLRERVSDDLLQAYVGRWERPLVGRKRELQLIQTKLEAALGGQGSILALSGPTGVGKSRLAAAAVQHWLAHDGSGLLGESYPHTIETPYSLWRSIWLAFLGLTPELSVEAQVKTVVERTQRLVPDCGDDICLWGEVLGLPMPLADSLKGLTAEIRQGRFFTLVRRCLMAQAAEQPLLIVMEGLHWADQVSLALLDELAAFVADKPICFFIMFRPEKELALTLLQTPICTRIPVSDLTPEAARRLLEDLVGIRKLPASVEQHLGLQDRGGRDSPVNPLFLEEAVRMLQGIGVLQQDTQLRVDINKLAKVQVPDTIHGLLLARLDRLPVAERDLLQVASVIGRQFEAEPLSVLFSEPSPQLIIMLAELSEAEMTRLLKAEPEWIYLFQHAMTHEVAYESLPYVRRQLLHALIADWIVEKNAAQLKPFHPVLAYHYGRAGNDKKGLHYAMLAGNDARDIFANQEAVDLYTQAERHLQVMAEDKYWQTAVALYTSRLRTRMLLGDLDGAREDAQSGLQLAEDRDAPVFCAELYALLAEINFRQGNLTQIKELTTKVVAELAEVALPEHKINAYIWAGWAESAQLDYQSALDHLELAEALCAQHEMNVLLARVLEAKSYAHYQQKELKKSLTAMQKGVEISREFSTPLNLGTALNNVGFVQYMLGHNQEALATFEEALAFGYQSGHNLLVMALINRAATFARLGDFDNAQKDFVEAAEMLSTMNYPKLEVEMRLFWGFEYYSSLAMWAEARKQFLKAKAIIDLSPESYLEEEARLLLGLAQVALKQGALAEAKTLMDEAEATIEQRALSWWQPVITYLFAQYYIQIEDIPLAYFHLTSGLEAIEKGGAPEYKPLILWELAAIEANLLKKQVYLEQCIQAAREHARFTDRVHCWQLAGKLLLDAEDSQLKALGQWAVDQATALTNRH